MAKCRECEDEAEKFFGLCEDCYSDFSSLDLEDQFEALLD